MQVSIGNKGSKPGVRLAFPVVHVAKQFQGTGEPAYSASFILDPVENKEDIQALDDAILAVATEKWGAKAKAIVDGLRKKDLVCFVHGPKTDKMGQPYAGFEGCYHLNARNGGKPGEPPLKPTLVDSDPKVTLTPDSGKPYGGCYVIAYLDIWVQENGYGTRINCSMRGLQFRKHGAAFAGGTAAAANEFEDVSEEAEEFFA